MHKGEAAPKTKRRTRDYDALIARALAEMELDDSDD
jgi:hypothetical protein